MYPPFPQTLRSPLRFGELQRLVDRNNRYDDAYRQRAQEYRQNVESYRNAQRCGPNWIRTFLLDVTPDQHAYLAVDDHLYLFGTEVANMHKHAKDEARRRYGSNSTRQQALREQKILEADRRFLERMRAEGFHTVDCTI
jgi:hypothetical protein